MRYHTAGTEGLIRAYMPNGHYDNPNTEGYKVVYEDNSASWSPKAMFEKSYREIGYGLTFGEAFEQVKRGKAMRLPQWKEDVKIRCANIPTNVGKKESVLCCICTDVIPAVGRDLTEEEETTLKEIVGTRIHEQMTVPFLYVESRFGRVPWKETMIELFSEDWEIVE
jgi:hypothetical protein